MAITVYRSTSQPSRLLNELLIFGALAGAFLALLVTVPHAHPSALDRNLMEAIQGIRWGSFSFVPRLGSDIGGGVYGAYLFPAIAAALFAVTRQWRLLALLGGVFVLHYVLISPKLFVDASRPSPLFGVDGAGGLESFPSGHVQWATSFYGLLAFVGWRSTEGPGRWAVAGAYVLVVLGTMLGRMELGRHWPLDTVAGVIAGLIALRIVVMAHAIRLPGRSSTQPAS